MSSGSSYTSSSTGSDPHQAGPPPRIPRLGWAIAFVLSAVVITAAYLNLKSTQAPQSFRAERIAEVPAFQFTAQDGSPVTLADLKGKIWVANFIFTRCAGPCPVMTSRMAELSRNLAPAKDVQLISVTVDPAYDTPEVLAEYGRRMDANPAKWKFLTGRPEKIKEFVGKGMLLPLDMTAGEVPEHSTRFVLVDRDGWIRGYQDGNDPEVVQKLLMDIGDLLRETPPAKKPVMKKLPAAVFALLLAHAPAALACVGCRQPGSGVYEPETIAAGVAFSCGVITMLIFVFSLLGGMTTYMVHTCRRLERERQGQ